MAWGNRMLFEVEFLRFTDEAPEGELLRRVVGAFADPKAVEREALKEASSTAPMADGFRIYLDGTLKKTVFIRPMANKRLTI